MLAQLELSLATFKIKQMLSAPKEDFSCLELNLSHGSDARCIVWCCQIPALTPGTPFSPPTQFRIRALVDFFFFFFFRKRCLHSSVGASLKCWCTDPGIARGDAGTVRNQEGCSGREWGSFHRKGFVGGSVLQRVRRHKETKLWGKAPLGS